MLPLPIISTVSNPEYVVTAVTDECREEELTKPAPKVQAIRKNLLKGCSLASILLRLDCEGRNNENPHRLCLLLHRKEGQSLL